MIALLDVLEFRSNNTAHRPVIDALALITRYAKTGNLTYYPLGETVTTSYTIRATRCRPRVSLR